MESDKAEGWDYVFLYSNVPAPRMLDSVRLAVEQGRKVCLAYLDRGADLVVVEPLEGCEVRTFAVNFRAVQLSRFIAWPRIFLWFYSEILGKCTRDCIVYTDSMDLLAMSRLAKLRKPIRIFHHVRDLHSIQLGDGVVSKVLRIADRLLLRGVETLSLTSEGFYQRYHKNLYSGNYVIVENWPDFGAWDGFSRANSFNATELGEFCVGFVGVIRYMDCLKALVGALDILRDRGVKIRLKVAGGGESSQLAEATDGRDWVKSVGPFSYGGDIQSIYQDVDLIWSVYDTRIKNVQVAMPNKFYEAILSRIPIVVASGTYLEERVKAIGIGTSVPCLDATAIAGTLGEACAGGGWYDRAEEALELLEVSEVAREEHLKSRLASVLGIGDPLPIQ